MLRSLYQTNIEIFTFENILVDNIQLLKRIINKSSV